MQSSHLQKPFREGFDPFHAVISAQSPIEKIQIKRLLRRCKKPGVKKRLVQCPIESVSLSKMRSQ